MKRLGSFPEAAIFDKDGTLIDTESLYFEAFDRLLKAYGCRHDIQTHAPMMGASTDTCLSLLQARHAKLLQGAEARAPLAEELLWHIYDVRAERGTRPMPGAQAILEWCRAQGIRLAMATSASRENTERDLNNLGWRDWFEAVVTAADVTRHKPEPDVFLEAAKRLGIDPGRCVAFEDGARGVQSAHAAGMRVVFVQDARFAIPEPHGTTVTVGSLVELL